MRDEVREMFKPRMNWRIYGHRLFPMSDFLAHNRGDMVHLVAAEILCARMFEEYQSAKIAPCSRPGTALKVSTLVHAALRCGGTDNEHLEAYEEEGTAELRRKAWGQFHTEPRYGKRSQLIVNACRRCIATPLLLGFSKSFRQLRLALRAYGYLLDSNVFIQAKIHYCLDSVSFWDWLITNMGKVSASRSWLKFGRDSDSV